MNKLEKISVWMLITMLVLLATAYIYGLSSQMSEMIQRPVRITYFISDILVLYPLGIIAIVGMFKNKIWGRRFFLLTLGALLFDMAHQVCYLIWENYSGLPLIYPILLLAVIIGFSIFSYYALFKYQSGGVK